MVLMASQAIDFGGERRARMVVAPAAADAGAILDALGLELPDAVLMIFGGAAHMEAGLETEIAAAFRNSILPVVAACNALIIDGGTQAGIMEIVGTLGAEGTPRPIMLGVAPLGAVTFPGKAHMADVHGFATVPEAEIGGLAPLDPNHSHFALTPTTEWGSETAIMFQIAAALSKREAKPRPLAALLFNGGMIAKQEALQCVRQGWPLIALQGTGRLADQIAQAKSQHNRASDDAELTEIITSHRLKVVSLADVAVALGEALGIR